MPQVINNLNQSFIGIVKGYDLEARTVDVFIPKLMPTVPEGREDITTMTNLSSNNINISYNSNITQTSTITARAKDMDLAIPEIDSRVTIEFLDGIATECFWDKWNINGDYQVIEEEKYPKQFSFRLNDKQIDVNLDDEIVINFPNIEKIILSEDPNNKKRKIFDIHVDNSTDEDLTTLFNIVGLESFVKSYTTESGETTGTVIQPTGIFKLIESLTKTVTDLKTQTDETIIQLQNKITQLESTIASMSATAENNEE